MRSALLTSLPTARFIGKYYQFVRELGEGKYNKVSKYRGTVQFLGGRAQYGDWVVKQPKLTGDVCNNPRRFASIFAEINPGIPVGYSAHGYVIMRYLGRKEPTDGEIAQAIIDIYQRTGRIVMDGCNAGNFLKADGRVICVDLDAAIRRQRRPSLTSATWLKKIKADAKGEWKLFYNAWHKHKPISVLVIKLLWNVDLQKFAELITQEQLGAFLKGFRNILNHYVRYDQIYNAIKCFKKLATLNINLLSLLADHPELCKADVVNQARLPRAIQILADCADATPDHFLAVIQDVKKQRALIFIDAIQWLKNLVIKNINLLSLLADHPELCKVDVLNQASLPRAIQILADCADATPDHFLVVIQDVEKQKALIFIDEFKKTSTNADYVDRLTAKQSIETFCQAATKSCLQCWNGNLTSEVWKPRLTHELQQKTNQLLGDHVNWFIRGFADFLIGMTIIGLLIVCPIKRYCTGSWFFSTAPTRRARCANENIISAINSESVLVR